MCCLPLIPQQALGSVAGKRQHTLEPCADMKHKDYCNSIWHWNSVSESRAILQAVTYIAPALLQLNELLYELFALHGDWHEAAREQRPPWQSNCQHLQTDEGSQQAEMLAISFEPATASIDCSSDQAQAPTSRKRDSVEFDTRLLLG